VRRARLKSGLQSGDQVRAVIYCRVSTKDQVQNLSLDTQPQVCSQYCNRQGLEVDRVFIEPGESAKTANRTQFQALLTHCRERKGRIQYVVVYSVTRFAREKYDHYLLRAQLQRLGVTLRSATEPIDDSSTGKLMEGIVSAFAQFDNDVRSERTVEGMKARLKRGGWTFKAPLGYLSRRDSMGRKILVPDPDRASFVTHSFELYSSGLYNKNQVLRIVTKMGLRSCSGKALTPQSFGAMLRKPIYAGRIVVRGWDVTTAADFEPLVTSQVFERVQALLGGRRSSVSPRPQATQQSRFPAQTLRALW
jgi:site-specific DNA recombinase